MIEDSMRRLNVSKNKLARRPAKTNQKGVALVTTLLLLLLMTGMTVAMMLSVNSDMLINGYYRNYRGSFYAADSGLAIARAAIYNEFNTLKLNNFSISTQPIPTGTEATVASYITSTYGSYNYIAGSSSGSGQANGSWPGKFKITNVSVAPAPNGCTVLGGGGTCAAPTGAVTGYSYVYNYTLTAMGQSSGSEEATISDSGSLTINATLAPTGATTTSFAAWGMFIDQQTICSGSYLVPGTITGPVFTNGAWTFGDSGSYIFTDKVGQANSKTGFQYGNGTCNQAATSSNKNGSTTIAPQFQSTFTQGAASVPLPANDYNQRRAVLDGMGTNNTNPTNTDFNNVLRNVTKTKYPTAGAASGVYMPYSVDSSGNATMTGGGIYIQGDSTVTLSTSGTASQIYRIKQGSTTTTITVTPSGNSGAGTTVISDGTNTVTISGVPTQRDPSTGVVVQDATLLYDNGNITALTGPGSGGAAIQDGYALTVTAANDVTITGDLTYKTKPVTLTQNQIPGTPADTLIPGNDVGQVFGIFTAGGNINLANSVSNGNLEIDASIATISQGGSGGLVNTGNSINTLTILGGRIQNTIQNIGASTRNVFFDRRFAQNGFAPPWFPSTTVTANGTETATFSPPNYYRVQWLNQSSYY